MSTDLLSVSAREIAEAIRKRDISSEEIVRLCLTRIEAINPRLNAVVATCGERATAQARALDDETMRGESRGPLHGVPMTIKDTFDTEGVVTTYGSIGCSNHIPTADATVVARARAAGAVLVGKTNTPELTLSYDTDNRVYGRTHNPYDTSRMPGGSSGGAVAVVASRGSFFDIGSDLGGSIRLPAHFSGVCGLKPTSGRVPRTGHVPAPRGIYQRMVHVGPMSRRVEDLELLLNVMAGPDGKDPFIAPVPLAASASVETRTLRGAFFINDGIATASAETASMVTDVVSALEEAGLAMAEARPDGIEESVDLHAGLLRGWDGGALVGRLLDAVGTPAAESTLRRYLDAPAAPPEAIVELRERWDAFCSTALSFLERFDVVISPVNAHAALRPEELSDHYRGFSYTMTHNLTGWPAAVVRAGSTVDGLPIGVQIAAAPWRDDVVLAVAQIIEDALGGWHAPPA